MISVTTRLAVTAVALAGLAGCGASPTPAPAPAVTGSFADCTTLDSGSGAAPSRPALPDLRLPCFDGRSEVRVDQIKGPAVINLWASWCPPCREELPAFARLAAMPGAPKVIGVVNADRRDAAASLAADLDVSFPTLVDDDRRLAAALGIGSLPATIFIDDQGRITRIYRDVALTDRTLADLVASAL